MLKPTDLENIKYNISLVKENVKFVYYIVLEREVSLNSIRLYLEDESICNSFQKLLLKEKVNIKEIIRILLMKIFILLIA